MNFKIFTLEEANRLIPDLGRIVKQFNTRRQDLIYLQVELEALRSQGGPPPVEAGLKRTIAEKEAEVNGLRKELQALHRQVEELGCIVRDYDRGLVDFPAIVERQSAYLCWHLGEESIGYWHGPDDGFAGRRPLNVTQQGS